MPLPTLMLPGKLAAPNGDPKLQEELSKYVPLDYIIDWFRAREKLLGVANRVLILKSETASGKSTALPPEIYKQLIMPAGGTGPGMICTQPRVLTAIENVREMLKHQSKYMRLGEGIGWSTGSNKFRPKRYGMLSATIGTLAAQLKTATDEDIMAAYKYILIDETHERDLQTDMTISMLKSFLLRQADNPACPFVVLMSATFDPGSFLEYFNIDLLTNFIWCRGATAARTLHWEWNSNRMFNNYPQAAAMAVERIISLAPDEGPLQSDILIFMPGAAEFKQTAVWLNKLNEKLAAENIKVFSLLLIDGEAIKRQNIDYKRLIFIPTEQHTISINGTNYVPNRRVIICTNVAETGLTLDDLKYVIDAGYNREIEYHPLVNIRALLTKPAPKSRVEQRIGRGGRKFPGEFYPLYPKYVYDMLPTLQFPQILTGDVSEIIIDMVYEQIRAKERARSGPTPYVFSVADIDMIDTPSPDALKRSLTKMQTLGFIGRAAGGTGPGFVLTELGTIARSFMALPPELIRMILAGYYWGVAISDLASIAAYIILGASNFIAKPADSEAIPPPISWPHVYANAFTKQMADLKYYKLRTMIADDFIEGIILCNMFMTALGDPSPLDKLREVCKQSNIDTRTALTFMKTRDEIIEQILGAGLRVWAQGERDLFNTDQLDFMNYICALKYCIYDGFKMNLVSYYESSDCYKTAEGVTVTVPAFILPANIATARDTNPAVARPSRLLYAGLGIKYKPKIDQYVVSVDMYSVCDGFVNVDSTI